jgi:hypothetical protein
MLQGFAVFFLVSACTTGVHIQPEDRRARGFSHTPEAERVAAQRNADLLKQYRDEWQFNRNPDGPPQLCVAMSGGGMRSASYNIGVLQGLHELGVLPKVDILSSVSGGGYALSWFYLQQYYSKQYGHSVGPDDLFDRNGRFQDYLGSHGNLLYRTTTGAYEIGRDVLSWLVTLPANIVANGIFDWRINLNPWRHDYENNIERVFHLVPDPVYGKPLNAAWFWSTSTVEPKGEAELPQLRAFLLERHLPYFIINTTAAIDDDGWRYNSELSKNVYEFTPLHHGSDAFGYRQDAFPVNMSRAVSISGAAYDSTSLPGARRQVAASLINGDLGYHIENPQANTPWWLYMMPFPLYVLPHNVRDIHGPSIYLTDGGHSENLAAYSVVRRLCRHIVIVDAEHDPNYQFEGLRRLQRRLTAELGVELRLPVGKPYNRACPVLGGQIGEFPVANGVGRAEAMHLGVTYIKLAMDTDHLDKYPQTVADYYNKHPVVKKSLLGIQTEDPFPQQPTSDQKFSEGQFQAYRDLGHFNTVTYFRTPGCAVGRVDATPRSR